VSTATINPPTTRRLECAVLNEDEVADLLGIPVFRVRELSITGKLPGIARQGADYIVPVFAVDQLRRLRRGEAPTVVFAPEAKLDWDAGAAGRREIAAAIAAGDARVAQERAAYLAEGRRLAVERKAREERQKVAREAAAVENGVRSV
jgi:hypothetical protein